MSLRDARPVAGLTSLLIACAAAAGPFPDVLFLPADGMARVSIVDRDLSTPDLSYVLDVPTGICVLDLAAVPDGVRSLTLDLPGLTRLESVAITPPAGRWTELHAAGVQAVRGVRVDELQDRFRVTIAGPGMPLIRAGGRLQIVDAWR